MTLVKCEKCEVMTEKVLCGYCSVCTFDEFDSLIEQIQNREITEFQDKNEYILKLEKAKIEASQIFNNRESKDLIDDDLDAIQVSSFAGRPLPRTTIIEEKNQPERNNNDALISIGLGTAAGIATAEMVGGMGLAVAGTAFGISAAPVAAVGAIAGTAVYGAKRAIEEGDGFAVGVIVAGAGIGAGISATVGGIGLAIAGTAVGISMAPVAAVGAVVGLAGYGIFKLFGGGDHGKK